MLVATAVMLVGLLLACELLDESARLLHHSVRRARDPTTLLATEMLRNDLRGTQSLVPTDGDWTSLPLFLEMPGTGQVTWWYEDGGLLRSVDGGAGRRLLGSVREFRWRTLRSNVVEVEATVHESGNWGSHAGGGLVRADPGRDRRFHWLVVAGVNRRGW
jgi:hypothetical protein